MRLLYGAEPIKVAEPPYRGGNMKFLEKGVYKIFGAIVLVSMVEALVAEPVALGDCGAYLANHADSNWARALGYAAQGVGYAALNAAYTAASASWELFLCPGAAPEVVVTIAAVGGSGLVLSA